MEVVDKREWRQVSAHAWWRVLPHRLFSRCARGEHQLMNGRLWLALGCFALAVLHAQPGRFLRGDSVAIQMGILKESLPPYPPSAIQARRQGLVTLEVTISADGKVAKTVIQESFDEEAGALAVKAVGTWLYKPIPQGNIAAGYPRIGPVRLRYSLTADGPKVVNEAAVRASQVLEMRAAEAKK